MEVISSDLRNLSRAESFFHLILSLYESELIFNEQTMTLNYHPELFIDFIQHA